MLSGERHSSQLNLNQSVISNLEHLQLKDFQQRKYHTDKNETNATTNKKTIALFCMGCLE